MTCLWRSCGAVGLFMCWAAGCAAEPAGVNPSFPLTVEKGRADLVRMAKDPRPLDRPLVILRGFADPGLGG